MRFVVALGALAAIQLAGIGPGQAYQAYYDGPWCAQSWGGDTLITNCSMRSFEMCLNEIHGTGGNTLCSPNPRYHAAPVERTWRHRKAA